MTSSPTSGAWIRLRGHEAVAACVDLVYRSPRTRLTSTVLTIFGGLVLAPVLFFIPPHVPWVLLAVGGGTYLGVRQWRGEYVVSSFTGECPRCHTALTIAPGTKIRLPHSMDCFQCHHEPVLEVTGAADAPDRIET
jgi:hypothetical protein